VFGLVYLARKTEKNAGQGLRELTIVSKIQKRLAFCFCDFTCNWQERVEAYFFLDFLILLYQDKRMK
jgi:hypothetical protein